MKTPAPILITLTAAVLLALLPQSGMTQEGAQLNAPQADPPFAPSEDGPSEDGPPEDGPTEDGLSLIERGFGLMMENLFREVGPDLGRIGDDMSDALSRLAPALGDLSALVDDLRNYQAPERLENGDIIIRRKADAPPPPPIGENLRNLTRPQPDGTPPPSDLLRPDPAQPEISL